MKQDSENICPFCGHLLEVGYVVGDVGNSIKIGLIDYPYNGSTVSQPARKSLTELGEELGKFEAFIGSYALGRRCKKCRK